MYIDFLLGDIHQNFSRANPPRVSPYYTTVSSGQLWSYFFRTLITLYPPSSPSFFRFFDISVNYLSIFLGDALYPPCSGLPALLHNMASSDLRMIGVVENPGSQTFPH